jgi:hypothetical protein
VYASRVLVRERSNLTDQQPREIFQTEWAGLDWRPGRKSGLPWTECRGSTIAIFGTASAYKYNITRVRNGVKRQWLSRAYFPTVDDVLEAARLLFVREGL